MIPSENIQKINILVTLDENYIPQMNVMLTSLLHSNTDCRFDVYLLHSSIREEALSDTRKILGTFGNLIPIKSRDIELDQAPTTDRYPQEVYYRIFAAKYLPDTLDRILYLDPDIIVNGSVRELYQLPMDEYYFAATTHIRKLIHKFNEIRLDMDEDSPYINSGILLMNLKRLREEQDYEEVFQFIESRKNKLMLPDQDIISTLYGSKIYMLDFFIYNMSERMYQMYAPFEKDLNLEWVRKHSVIIHYCGRNKPWKPNYRGQLDVFYHENVKRMEEKIEKIEKKA